jgi:hypothetical protein
MTQIGKLYIEKYDLSPDELIAKGLSQNSKFIPWLSTERQAGLDYCNENISSRERERLCYHGGIYQASNFIYTGLTDPAGCSNEPQRNTA